MSVGWFYQADSAEVGPVTPAELSQLAESGRISNTTLVRRIDMEKWVPAGKVKGLIFQAIAVEELAEETWTRTKSQSPKSVVEIAVSESGKRIALYSDRTWDYVVNEKTQSLNVLASAKPTGISSASEPNFRKARWGMSEREVRDTEEGEPIAEPKNAIVYKRLLSGMPCDVYYVFCHKQLVWAQYQVVEEHTNKNAYIEDFGRLKQLLVEKYGRPVSANGQQIDQLWLNDLFQDDYSQWGHAISIGHLIFRCQWELDSTVISLTLSGDNYEIALCIMYVSRELGHLVQEESRRESLNDL